MSLLLDLRHLTRSLRCSPVSAAAAVLTLSLTLGAGASVFAVVDGALLTPPPFASPEALYTIEEVPVRDAIAIRRAVPLNTLARWREAAVGLARLEAFDGTNLTLTGLGPAARIGVLDVTPGLLSLLGVAPAIGRSFDAADVGQPVVVLTHAFWEEKLSADPGAIGRTLVLGNQPHTIVGVLPARFVFAIDNADLWRVLPISAASDARADYRVRVLARIAGGASPATLERRLDTVSRESAPPAQVVATAIATRIAGDSPATLGVLAAASAVAVLIAFINLSGFLLVRSLDRRKELAVRTAVGADGWETAKQLSMEAVLLVGLGLAGGAVLATWMTPMLAGMSLEFGGLAGQEVTVSWWSLGGIAAAAAIGGAACVALPAISASRWHVPDLARRTTTPSRHELLLRRVCVAGEVSLAFVLLVALALLGRTLATVLRVDPGFDAKGVQTAQVSLPAASYSTPERTVLFYDTLQRALQERLGTTAVAVVDELPLTGDGGRRLVGLPAEPGREAVLRTASPHYFTVMGIPVLAGRPFDVSDHRDAPPRVVISRSLSAQLFGDQSAIGRQIQVAGAPRPAEIVGVVGDVTHRSLGGPLAPTVYLSGLQVPSRSSILTVRSSLPDATVVAIVREEAARLDASLPVYGVRRMTEIVARSPGMPATRLLTTAFAAFATLAVVLSIVGLFGVAAHDVSRR